MKLQTKKVRPNCSRPAPFETGPAHAESITATILPPTETLVNEIWTNCDVCQRTLSQNDLRPYPRGSQILSVICTECMEQGW